MKQQAFILYACLSMAHGLSTQVLPFAKEESKKRGLLHRHLHACECNGGRRNLVESAQAMRGLLTDMSVQELTDQLMLTLRGEDVGADETPPYVPIMEPADTEEDEHVAMEVVGILEGTVGDLEELAISTAHYQEANQVVSQDVTEIVNAIFDFIIGLINLVISVISQVISLILDIVFGIINIIVDVIVAIFQFIVNIIKSIINFFLGLFNADVDADNKSFLHASTYDPEEADSIPGLRAIYDTLILGAQALGLGELLEEASVSGDSIIDGVVTLGLTTAPLIMMEFISVTSVNSVLCALGLEGVLDECPTESEDLVDRDSFCAACDAAAEMTTP